MAQKDYVSRSKKSGQRKKATSKGKKSTSAKSSYKSWLMLVIVVGAFIAGLYFLKTSKQDKPVVTPTQQTNTNKNNNNKNNVPPLPEKRWGYPEQLTNPGGSRNTSSANMSPEQQRILAEMAADRPQGNTHSSTYNEQVGRNSQSTATTVPPRPTATTTRPATTPTPNTPTRPATAASSTAASSTTRSAAQSSTTQASSTQSKNWSLQCGAFRNKDGAESIKAQLALSGIASQVIFSNNLHRVVIGPFSTQSAANSMQTRAQNAGVSGCSVKS